MPDGGAPALQVAVDVALLTLATPAGSAGDDGGSGDATGGPLLGLVVRREQEPFSGMWALPGVRLGERDRLEDTAAGTLRRAGVPAPRHLEQLATFGDPRRDPRGRILSVSHLALCPAPAQLPSGSAWVQVLDPPPLAFDHTRILAAAVKRLRGKLTYSTVAYGLLPDTFTLTELQTVYEAVLAQRLDKRNFRKKVLGLGMVEATGEQRRGAHRPAGLHRFRRQGLVDLGDVITA